MNNNNWNWRDIAETILFLAILMAAMGLVEYITPLNVLY